MNEKELDRSMQKSLADELIRAIESEYEEVDLDKQILSLWDKYQRSNDQEKEIIDYVFISITGWSFDSLKRRRNKWMRRN